MRKITILLGCWLFAGVVLTHAQDPGFREPERRRGPERESGNSGSDRGNSDRSDRSEGSDDTSFAAGRIRSMDQLNDSRPLQIGDYVSLHIVEDRGKVLSLRVQDSGDLQAPYLGLVPAAGRTPKEVAHYMKEELQKQYFQQATVIIALERINPRARVQDETGYFTIYGQVARAGKYELLEDEDITISQAILRAGGFAQFAKPKNVQVIRRTPKGNVNIVVNVHNIMQKGHMQYDFNLRPDDVIIVREKKINF